MGWGHVLDGAEGHEDTIENESHPNEGNRNISRQLYAILVAKLEGKAFGIVQPVPKGAGAEAWRQLKLEYEGRSGNRQAALLRSILNPKTSWEADVTAGKSLA